MNKLLRYLSVMACVVLCSLQANAATFYSKVVVTSDMEGGLVYVSDSNATPSTDDFNAESSAEKTSNKIFGSKDTHTYYLKAKVAEEYADKIEFLGWYLDGELKSSEIDYTLSFETKSKDINSPESRIVSAHFRPIPAVRLKTSEFENVTTSITPEENTIATDVTLTVNIAKIPSYGCVNLCYVFEGWKDEKNQIVSTDPVYKFKATERTTLTPVIKYLSEQPTPGKYYRIRNVFNRTLSLEGNYKIPVNDAKVEFEGINPVFHGVTADLSLLRWALPTNHNFADFQNKHFANDDNPAMDVESSPSTIFYLTGNTKGGNVEKVSFLCQGEDAKAIMDGNTLTLKPMNSTMSGYYYLEAKNLVLAVAGVKMTYNEQRCDVYVGRVTDEDPYSAMAFQPIDEEHMDYFWFGAKPDEALEFENGYWSTMYTAFPYQCKDGLEAYYIKGTTKANGITYACLERVQGDKVPAATAVLLKCQGLTTKENRLLPLSPDTQIPALEGNLLKGVYQLYNSSNKDGRVNFDESTMRVLGVNSAGAVGFFKMKANEDGSAAELLANKAYLDLSSISPANVAAGYKLVMGDQGSTAIDSIESDDKSVKYENQPVYDLTGRQVANPEAGNIYIVDGKKIVWK